MESRREHIVMVPMLAHGHLIPFLALAKQIQQLSTCFTVTIANTPLNIKYLKSTMESTPPEPNIHLVELPFSSSDHGLPPNTESTENLSLGLILDLLDASASLQTPFQNLIHQITNNEGKPPICIISDAFCGWAIEVAKATGTVSFTFTTSGAYGSLAYMSIWQNLPHRKTNSHEFNVPGFPNQCLFQLDQLHHFMRIADGSDAGCKFFRKQLSLSMKSCGWLCNTIEEIEPLGVESLRNYINLPLFTVGPLLPQSVLDNSKPKSSSTNINSQRAAKVPGLSADKCIEWLDSHMPSSVIYISFGSQNTISQTQMMELAIGLEITNKPFIWVIRPPLGFDIKGEIKPEWFPKGFMDMKKGLLVKNWAPQLDILSHKSVGAFLSHCGWNSVLESLSQGVPIIGWPLAAEQSYNSKMLVEEMGVSVELARGVEGCIKGSDVKRVIELAMAKKEATEIIGGLIKGSMKDGGSSVQALNRFISEILSHRANV